MFSKFRDFDFYRKIPKDLTEASTHGSLLSVFALLFMLSLFVLELSSFLTLQLTTNIILDPNTEARLRINFNITVLDMVNKKLKYSFILIYYYFSLANLPQSMLLMFLEPAIIT